MSIQQQQVSFEPQLCLLVSLLLFALAKEVRTPSLTRFGLVSLLPVKLNF